MIAHIPPPTSRSDLERLSAANAGWKIEREADGTISMSPTNSQTGRRNARLIAILSRWSDERAGGAVFDSSTGFTMPDGAVLSPDAAWVSDARWSALSDAERFEYAPIVPDVCVELLSPSDSREAVIVKARRYLAYGAVYVLVIDPKRRDTWSAGVVPADFPTDFSKIFDA